MPVSTPMKLCTYRISEAEKQRLQRLAAERNVTLSYAIREGLRMYLDELRDGSSQRGHVAAS